AVINEQDRLAAGGGNADQIELAVAVGIDRSRGGQAGFEGEGREIFRAAEEDLAVAGDEIEAAVVVEVGSEELGGVGRSCFRKIRAIPGGAFVFVGKAKDLAIVA